MMVTDSWLATQRSQTHELPSCWCVAYQL